MLDSGRKEVKEIKKMKESIKNEIYMIKKKFIKKNKKLQIK